MQIPEIFKKCEALTMSKRQDYTTNPLADNHENFRRSGEIASWFTNPDDKPYAILVGTKLARLASLRSSGRTPNNESIEDSFLDLINYCALWMERVTLEAQSLEVQSTQATEQQPTKDTSPSRLQLLLQRLQELTRELHLTLDPPSIGVQNTAALHHQTMRMDSQKDSLGGTQNKNPYFDGYQRNLAKDSDSQ